MEETYRKKIVIALGGNAILQAGEKGTAEEQVRNIRNTCARLAPIISSWYEVVITHGNGPQVGNILIQNEAAMERTPAMPLDVCGAQSQGLIGYLIGQTLANQIGAMGKGTEVVAVLSQVIVSPEDPEFQNPSKPVGPFLSREEMERLKKPCEAWVEIPQKGWRKVVPSPRPLKILNSKSIRCLLESGTVVIACGGGGIPVVETPDGSTRGVEGVIDKDLATECLATGIGAQIVLILTDVPGVMSDFGSPDQKHIRQIGLEDIRAMKDSGVFPKGTIGPKIEAAIRFVENGGEKAVIANLEQAEDALKGRAGTTIRP